MIIIINQEYAFLQEKAYKRRTAFQQSFLHIYIANSLYTSGLPLIVFEVIRLCLHRDHNILEMVLTAPFTYALTHYEPPAMYAILFLHLEHILFYNVFLDICVCSSI